MFYEPLVSIIGKAGGEIFEKVICCIDFPKKQSPISEVIVPPSNLATTFLGPSP
jgi:hypothetical protein